MFLHNYPFLYFNFYKEYIYWILTGVMLINILKNSPGFSFKFHIYATYIRFGYISEPPQIN
jgi:hypothetical protein